MINYQNFLNYLRELVRLFHQQKDLRNKSKLAQKYHCMDISKDMFYQNDLHLIKPESITLEFAKKIRDKMRKEPTPSEQEQTTVPEKPAETTDETKPTKFKAGQIITNGRDILLIDHIVGDEMFIFFALMYVPESNCYIFQTPDLTVWTGNKNMKPASGPQVARLLGELRNQGYPYDIDQANGLFFVKRKVVDVYSGEMPEGFEPIRPIINSDPSPYRFVLENHCEVLNAHEHMLECKDKQSMMLKAVFNQIKQLHRDTKSIQTYCEFQLPRLCCAGTWITPNAIGFVKDDRNRCYWLAKEADILRLLAWIAYV